MMADDTKATVEKIRALLDPKNPARAELATPAVANQPAPGFRFANGDNVIDLVTGGRGVVVASYYTSAGRDRVYEVRTGPGALIARLEKELERDGPQNVPQFLPRI